MKSSSPFFTSLNFLNSFSISCWVFSILFSSFTLAAIMLTSFLLTFNSLSIASVLMAMPWSNIKFPFFSRIPTTSNFILFIFIESPTFTAFPNILSSKKSFPITIFLSSISFNILPFSAFKLSIS